MVVVSLAEHEKGDAGAEKADEESLVFAVALAVLTLAETYIHPPSIVAHMLNYSNGREKGKVLARAGRFFRINAEDIR